MSVKSKLLTETDTDTPIATFNGYLNIYLNNTNQTNYTRVMANNGKIIDDLQTYLVSLKQNLSTYTDNAFVSVQRQIFQGNVGCFPSF